MTMDQARALERARRGLEEGFRWLFERHKDPVYGFIVRSSRLDRDAAHDVLQNTFIRAFRSLASLKDDARFEAWLYRIARREMLRLVQRRQLDSEPLESELDVMCEREENLAELRERERLLATVRELLGSIEPEVVRDTAARYYLGERCTTESVAEELGVPHATVRKRLFLFRNKLRARLLETWHDLEAH
jgi:RNA polymerase sigma-70 factor, ECF subfamily